MGGAVIAKLLSFIGEYPHKLNAWTSGEYPFCSLQTTGLAFSLCVYWVPKAGQWKSLGMRPEAVCNLVTMATWFLPGQLDGKWVKDNWCFQVKIQWKVKLCWSLTIQCRTPPSVAHLPEMPVTHTWQPLRTPLVVDLKILSIRREPMLNGFLTLNI